MVVEMGPQSLATKESDEEKKCPETLAEIAGCIDIASQESALRLFTSAGKARLRDTEADVERADPIGGTPGVDHTKDVTCGMRVWLILLGLVVFLFIIIPFATGIIKMN